MAATVPAEFHLCRMFRSHAWESYTPDRATYTAPPWGTTFHFRCVRCATARHDTIDSLGDLSTRRYQYPDGYRLTADETPSTQELRLQYMKQLNGSRRRRSRRKIA